MKNTMAQIPSINLLAAVLSAVAFPGVGQMIKGEVLKGVLILNGFIFGLVVVVVMCFIYIPAALILTVILICAYLWNIYDAFTHDPLSSKRREVRGVRWQ